MDKLFIDELNTSCYNKNKKGWEQWTPAELEYIKQCEGRDYCLSYFSTTDLCDSCKMFQIRIQNFYTDISTRELNDKVNKLFMTHTE